MDGGSLQYLEEVLDVCRRAEQAHQLYQSSAEDDPAHIWDARSQAFEKECECVGAYFEEIQMMAERYRRAIWFLQDIAAMGHKIGSETAAHALAQLNEPRSVDEEERQQVTAMIQAAEGNR